MKLIGRTNEVVLLQSYVESQQAEFIAMYGRRRRSEERRVGKECFMWC